MGSKKLINRPFAHSNLTNAHSNFDMNLKNDEFKTSFFDHDDNHKINANL